MPEYLAPDVYVEEIDTGSKPIEGVSTSTAGSVGVTERGPVGVPILTTSWGEYRRWFGDLLNADLYGDHRFFPHAVEGFFTNGGKRLYVVRVLSLEAASNAGTLVFAHESSNEGAILLTRSAAGSLSVLFVGSGAAFPVALTRWIRVGTGSDAEYRQPTALPAAATTAVVSGSPFQRTHAIGAANVEHYGLPALGPARTLVGPHPAGSKWLTITGAGAAPLADRVLQIADAGPPVTNEELHYMRTAVDLGSNNWRIELETPLQFAHADGESARMLGALAGPTVTGLTRVAVPADSTLVVTASAGFTAGDLVRVVEGTRGEIRRIGAIHAVTLGAPLGRPAPAGVLVEHVTRADSGAVRSLDEAVAAGTMALAVNDRQGLAPGDVIRVGAATDPDVEYAVIRELPEQLSTTPDPGRIVLASPLTRAHGGTTPPSLLIVALQTITNQTQAGTFVHAVAAGVADTLVSRPLLAAPPGPTDLARVRVNDDIYYARIASHVARPVQELTFTAPLLLPHSAPQPLVVRDPLLDVVALDPGVWGNRLRVAARREPTPLVRSRIRNDPSGIQDPTHIRLDSAAGVEPGTILSLADATGTGIDTPFKVVAIDRQNGYLLTLASALPAAAALGSPIVSLEFAMGVYLLRQPDPAQPSRNLQVLDSEMFRHLSLDPRHSHYVQRVIGTTWTPGAPGDVDDDGRPLRRVDRRSEGDSAYIRVRDQAQDLPEPARTTTLQSIRLGPEFLVDVLPDGRREAARRALTGGDDQTAALTDADYAGADDPNPERRTGLNSLKNLDEISIVAAPGRVSAAMQDALIDHCELMRYRFAVLDAVAAARRLAGRRAGTAAAVRHEVRRALSPVAADSAIRSRRARRAAA